METTERYLVCKSLDAVKKSLNFVAILPKILINKHYLPSFTLEDFNFSGLILEIMNDALPIISAQQNLIAMKEMIPKSNTDITPESESRVYTGIVSESNRNGVSIRFLDGLRKLVIVKDL